MSFMCKLKKNDLYLNKTHTQKTKKKIKKLW